MQKLKLTKNGFIGNYWDDVAQENVSKEVKLNWKSLIVNRTSPFEIEDSVKLFDIVQLLNSFDHQTLETLELLTNSNILPHLNDVNSRVTNFNPEKDSSQLKFIEVYKSYDADNYDSCDNHYSLLVSTSAHGIGKPWDSNGENELANSYAIEFSPWQELLHLPIVIKKESFNYFLHFKKNDSLSDRELIKDEKIIAHFDSQMTLEEFFVGLFNELCFFSSPERRDKSSQDFINAKNDFEKEETN